MKNPTRLLLLAAAWAASPLARAQSPAPTDPRITSWLVEPSGRYARIFETDAAKNAGDACNGRFCVTPEFPQGTFAYFTSIESDGTPRFPYNIGRWYNGTPSGGSVANIAESVTEYVRGGQAMAMTLTAVRTEAGIVLSWNSVEGGTYAIATSADGTSFSQLAGGITSAGLTTSFTTTTTANYYRVTLVAVAAYDTRGTGGLSGVNGTGTARYAQPVVGTSATARLVNIATRVSVGGTAGTPISGFVIGEGAGAAGKKMLIRAVGPTLGLFGVSTALSDPSLTLTSGGAVIASNDNWSAADATTMVAVGAFALSSGSRDAVVVTNLASGAYSAPVGANNGSGVALLEVYDAGASGEGGSLVNASTRAFVGSGEQVLIPGFVIAGSGTIKLLVRAVGPTLASFGVTGALADPQITLFRGSTAIATNDNWGASAAAAEIQVAAAGAGAFALASGSRDAALVATLEAGSYSAIVSGVDGATGTALVEMYVVQ